MKNETLARSLEQHTFFRKLRKEDLEAIAGCTRNQRYDAGDYVFREGGECKDLLFLRSGKIALELGVGRSEPVTVETLGPEDALGWRGLFPEEPWHLDARCIEPCLLFEVSVSCIQKHFERNPEFAFLFTRQLLTIIHRRLERSRLQLLDVYGSESADNA